MIEEKEWEEIPVANGPDDFEIEYRCPACGVVINSCDLVNAHSYAYEDEDDGDTDILGRHDD